MPPPGSIDSSPFYYDDTLSIESGGGMPPPYNVRFFIHRGC